MPKTPLERAQKTARMWLRSADLPCHGFRLHSVAFHAGEYRAVFSTPIGAKEVPAFELISAGDLEGWELRQEIQAAVNSRARE